MYMRMTYMYKTRSTMKFSTCNTINAYTKQIYLYTSDLYPYCSERTLPSNVKSIFKLKSPLTCTVHIHIIINTQSYAQLEIKCMISLFTVRRIINCTFERNYSCIYMYSVHTHVQCTYTQANQTQMGHTYNSFNLTSDKYSY